MRRMHSGMAAAALSAAGALVLLGVALALSGSWSSAADDGCHTVLAHAVDAGADEIQVQNPTGCDYLDWIVINQGGEFTIPTEECLQLGDTYMNILSLTGTLAYDHSAGESVDEVEECPPQPTPTPTPTPTYAPPSPTPPGGFGCGTYGDLQPWPGGAINPVPAFGAAGSSFDLELAGVEPNPDADQPAEVLWDWDPEDLAGELVGSGIVPRNEPATLLEGTVPVSAEPGAHTVTACWWHAPSETWYYKDAPFEVPELPPTPTPTVPPGAAPMLHCPQAGKWAISVWQGPDDTDTAEAFAACGEGAVDAAYALDPDTQAWQRYFPERPDISNLLTLRESQGVIARGKATPKPTPTPTPGYTPTPTPTPTPSAANQMHNCPQAGKWAIAVWEGANEIDTGEALATCEEEVEAVYALDPDSQAWQRYFPERVDISNLPMLINGQAMIARGKVTLGPQGHIVFVSSRDGNDEIYVMNADGTGQTRLTNNAASDWEPAWSPDGSKIAFASDRDGNWEIYVMNADGSGQTRLTTDPASDRYPAWSPDGSKIGFDSERDGNWEIYLMNPDGSGQANLTNNPAKDDGIAWSPDGSLIAFISDRIDSNTDIYIANADASNAVRLTSDPAPDWDPEWAPTGSEIAFVSGRDGNEEVYVMDSAGSNQTNLSKSPGYDSRPTWSPDGSKLAFASDRAGNLEVHALDAKGVTNLTNNPAVDTLPDWGP
jgi:hypothetical protein